MSLRGLRVRYDRVEALDGLSLDVAAGEFMVLVGPSGSGKSTLLDAVAGLRSLDAGRVFIGGRDVTAMEPGDRNIGMVFQSYALYPTITVARNITFGMRMRGASRAAAATKLAEVARLLQIEDLLGRRPSQLSGGQRQRVAIGRALARDPDVFLFDEPLSNLDAALRADVRAELKRLHQRLGTTILYVTHDQVEATTMATRVAVLNEGRILQVGEPDAVYSAPQDLFVAGFIGSPRMNLLHGHLEVRAGVPAFQSMDGAALPLDRYAWRMAPENGRPVVLGIRPEDLRRSADPGMRAVPMTVMRSETTGADCLVELSWNAVHVTARFHRDEAFRPSQILPIEIDMRRASVFCGKTGRRL